MTDRALQITTSNEPIKAYFVYDGSNRLTDKYEAREDAKHGEPCMRTRYTYDGVSARVQKKREIAATWDSAWDLT